MDCPCGGKNPFCLLCGGDGEIDLIDCPWAKVPGSIWETIELAKMAIEDRIWPILAGSLQQSFSFTQVVREVRQLDAVFKAESGIKI